MTMNPALTTRRSNWMYQVFVRCLQTSTSKAILKLYRDNKDIPKIWGHLCKDYGESVLTSVSALETKRWLMNFNFEKANWKGTAVSMIEYCMEQRRRHDLINPTSPITDENMIELLRIMSIGHKKFEPVYTTYQIQRKGDANAKEMTLFTYVALLRAAAQQIDASNGGRSGRRFSANVHDSSLYGIDASHDEQSYEAYVHDLQDTEFDTDTPLHVVQAYQAGQQPTRGSSSSSNFRLPNVLFFELSQEGKKAWASIPTSDKGAIIKYFTDNKPSARTSGNGQTTLPRDSQGKFKRSANEHDQSPSVEEKSGPDEDSQEDSGTVQSHHHEVHVSERKQVPEETRVLDLLQKNSAVKSATFGDIRAYLSEKSYIADREIATENKKFERWSIRGGVLSVNNGRTAANWERMMANCDSYESLSG